MKNKKWVLAIAVLSLLCLPIVLSEIKEGDAYDESLGLGVQQQNGTKKVIIELKEKPIIEKTKMLEKEAAKESKLIQHISDVEQEHADIRRRLNSVYKAKRIGWEYKHIFNGISAEVTDEEYKRLLNDKSIKKVWIDDVMYTQDTYAQMNETTVQIGAQDMWGVLDSNDVNITGNGTTIAILDSGIMYNHTDLGNCSYTDVVGGNCPRIVYMYDFVNDDNDAFDDYGHGTHCAGIAGANGNIKGVAPNATFIILKVCGTAGTCPVSAILAAMENATLLGADVISMSLGSSGYSNNIYAGAISNAMDNGTVIVASAGNDDTFFAVGQPSITLSAISVGALCMPSQLGESYCDDGTRIATFSSKGFALWSNGSIAGIKPDVSAPGVRINSTINTGPNDYSSKSGTSMSCPHVAGVVALLKQAHPDWDAYEIKAAIVDYAYDLNLSYHMAGKGEVNVPSSSNASLLMQVQDNYVSMVYFGDSFNWTVPYRNFSSLINITNRYQGDIQFNVSIENKTGIHFIYNSSPIELTANETRLLQINATVIITLTKTGYHNGTIIFSTNLSRMIKNVSMPYSLFAVNNSANCPSKKQYLTGSTTLEFMECDIPSFLWYGVFYLYSSDMTLDCKGSSFDGLYPRYGINYAVAYSGSDGKYNMTIKNCIFKNYGIGVGINDYDGITHNSPVIITNSTFINNSYGVYLTTSDNVIITNNTFLDNEYRGVISSRGHKIAIANNTFYGNTAAIAVYGTSSDSPSIYNSIVNNNISGGVGVRGQYIGNDIVIKDNFFDNISKYTYAFYIFGSTFSVYNSTIEGHPYSFYYMPDVVPSRITFVNVSTNLQVSGFAAISDNSSFVNKEYLSVNVTDNSSTFRAVQGATITVYDDNGTIDWSDITPANGMLKKPTLNFWKNKSSVFNHTHLNVTAYKEGYIISSLLVEMNSSKTILLVMPLLEDGEEQHELPQGGGGGGGGGGSIQTQIKEEENTTFLCPANGSIISRLLSNCTYAENGICEDGENILFDNDCMITAEKIFSGKLLAEMWLLRLMLIAAVFLFVRRSQAFVPVSIFSVALIALQGAFASPIAEEGKKMACVGITTLGSCIVPSNPLMGWIITASVVIFIFQYVLEVKL